MTDDALVEALKALAHPVRLRIMQALTGTERNVGEIDDAAEIGQPTLSQQLAVLRNAGLVKTRKDAKLVYYRIDDDRLSKVVDAAGGAWRAVSRTDTPLTTAGTGGGQLCQTGVKLFFTR